MTCLEKKAVKGVVVGVWGLESGLEPWSCPFAAVWLRAVALTSLSLNCLTCKMGKPRPSTVVRNKSNKVCDGLRLFLERCNQCL